MAQSLPTLVLPPMATLEPTARGRATGQTAGVAASGVLPSAALARGRPVRQRSWQQGVPSPRPTGRPSLVVAASGTPPSVTREPPSASEPGACSASEAPLLG